MRLTAPLCLATNWLGDACPRPPGARLLPLLAAALAWATASALADTSTWWEGEAALGAPPSSPTLAPANDQERRNLSGGDWLALEAVPPGTELHWKIKTPGGGPHELWVRRFSEQGPLRWRFDSQPWANETTPTDRSEYTPLDIRVGRYHAATWVRLGRVDLPKGRHDFSVTVASEGICAIDCFALLEPGRRPSGSPRPDRRAEAAPGWFAWDPPWPEGGPSPVDLRRLNPAVAGDSGWLRAEGEHFTDGQGQTVRFWGVSTGCEIGAMPPEALANWAARLARRGVNLVRIHAAPFYETEPGPLTGQVQAMVAACKAQGIRVALNWYCLAVSRVPGDWSEADGLKPGDAPFSLHLFHPPLQRLYMAWAKTLLTTPGPNGEAPIGRDPAVAFIELVDEDNFLFWTFDPAKMPDPVRAGLERSFAQWVRQQHGSIAAALSAWGQGPAPACPDLPEQGRLGLYPASLLGGASWMRERRNDARAGEQLRFLVETQRAWYDSLRRWLREEVGYGGPVLGTNWHTVDERVAGPAELYANQILELTAKNTYFSGDHRRGGFFPWQLGDGLRHRSMLREPEQALAMHIQAEGRPHVITEGGYTRPNRFRTEEPLLTAALASLQGIDGVCPFVAEGHWCGHLNYAWPISTPGTLGQYPAAALIYRLGLLQEGPVAFRDAVPLHAVFSFMGGRVGTKLGDDSRTREGGDLQRQTAVLPGIDPLTFWVGRVVRAVEPAPGECSALPGLDGYIDRQHGSVRSATGELHLDYARGLLRVDAPQAQGVAGFLGAAGPQTTTDVRFALSNAYAAAVIVSLDGLPLSRSKSMLLQVMTEERNSGWREIDADVVFEGATDPVPAQRIESIGGAPIEICKVSGQIALQRPDAAQLTVTALDSDLRPVRKVGTAASIRLRPDVLHYWICAR